MGATAITSGKDHPDLPVMANDLSDEIHIVWKETVSGNNSIRYWNNVPKTMADAVYSQNNPRQGRK